MTKINKFTQSPHFIRVLSLFLSIILWFYVTGEQRQVLGFERTLTFRDIPVSWRNLGEDLVITEMTESVSLTLQGMEYAFDGLTPADMEAFVDLQGKEENRHDIKVNANVPRGLTVVGIQPAKATVMLHELVATQMNVTPLYRGAPGDGMIISESDFSPKEVFVRGPRRQVENIDRVVFNMDVDGHTSFLTRDIRLYPVDNRNNIIEGVSVSPQEANVWVEFKYPRRDIPVEAIFKGENDLLRNYIVSPSSIAVEGPRYLLDEVSKITTGEIDLSVYEEDTTLEISLELPEGLRPVEHDTVQVRFFFNNI